MTVRELDETTVRQIAAGEVIERPASVVKELVENSLDADATRIDVAVERGGKERIRVADNGVGMSRDEVRLAVRQHTTSKIVDHGDLEEVETLGFRGEALYAIGAVGQMIITTASREGDRGTKLRMEHGEMVDVSAAGRAEGTTVEVTDLFGTTPARRKFLKTDQTEFDHVNRIVTRYALANPDVAISLIHGDREVFATTGQGDLEAALLAVYGRKVAESVIEVDEESVSGYVSHPETTRSSRDYVSTYVNGRYVSSTLLRGAIIDAYGDQLAPDRYPFAVLNVELSPSAVDANVHPRKLEVRFDDEAAVRRAVESAVRSALLDHGLVRSSSPRGRGAPEETAVSPETDHDETGGVVDRSNAGASESADPSSSPESRLRGGGRRSPANTKAPEDEQDEAARSVAELHHRRGNLPQISDRAFPAGRQTTLDDDTVAETGPFDRLPVMRLLGQLHETYILAETADGLVLIDQHAADERVTYERLRERLADPATQALADPVAVELTAREAELFETTVEALEAIGFRATPIDDRTVEVRAVPAVMASALDPSLLRDVLGEVVRERAVTSVDGWVDGLLADLACYPAITGKTGLTDGSIQGLLEALDDCENPYACPHGRPVVVEIGRGELDDRFERDYPGHRGRRAE